MVGVGLVRANHEALDRAERTAQAASRDLALALRSLLQHRAVLELVPPARRASWRGGSLAVDEAVGWLEPQPERPLPAEELLVLRSAAAAEFVQHDPAAAAATFARLRTTDGQPKASPALLLAAAWQAHRGGDASGVQVHREAADATLATLPTAALAEPGTAATVAARALLATARGEAFPDGLPALLAALPDELAHPLFARLAERGAESASLATAHATVAQRRRCLRNLADTWRDLPDELQQRRRGQELAIWFPGPERGSGDAALVDAEWLASLPGLGSERPSPNAELPPIPAGAQVVIAHPGEPLPNHADEVVTGFVGTLPNPAPPLPWTSRPGTLLGAAGLLLLVFVVSLGTLLHAAHSEALAVRARGEFLTGVTHELKTPLAAIRLIADVLQDDEVEATRQRDYVALLAGQTARLSTLLDNVLDLGRHERGERAYDRTPGDLARAVREALATFAPLAERAGLAVVLHEGPAAAPALFDAGAVQQVLLNLLDNARKYGPADGHIDVHTRTEAGRFEVEVRDQGPGVPDAEREAIFAQFVRGSRHRHGSVPGTGLGLFLARTIARAHGGELVCTTPAAGPGASFRLTLPMLEDRS
ncbi:MAG: HAMP domain-containing histidine kinase [Planctomycetes bacterium]|nr:HAMP domain-containing histidine kinase [Planctomycetota bacterium]